MANEQVDPFYATLDIPKCNDVCPIGGSVCKQLGCFLCSTMIHQAERGDLSDNNLRRLLSASVSMANDPTTPCLMAADVQAIADEIARHRGLAP